MTRWIGRILFSFVLPKTYTPMIRLNDSQVVRLQNQFETVLTAFATLPETQLRYRPIPDKWSAFEQLAHISRYTDVFRMERLAIILDETEPVFGRYKADDDPGFAKWVALDKAMLIQRFKQQRQQLTNFLMGLSEAELSRKASHPMFGSLDIAGWTEFFLLHESHHLFALFRLLHTQ